MSPRLGLDRRRRSWGVCIFLIALTLGNAVAFIRTDDIRKDTAAALAKQTRNTARKLSVQREAADRVLVKATEKNCKRIHLLDVTLEDIVVSARDSLRQYEVDGTITPEQLQRGLKDNARARNKLIGADCPPRSPLR